MFPLWSERQFNGPWLLKRDALDELAEILNGLNHASTGASQTEDTPVRIRNAGWEVKIQLEGDRVVIGRSIADCAQQLKGVSEVPRALSASHWLGSSIDIDGPLQIDVGSDWDTSLKIRADPRNALAAYAHAEIAEWASRHQQARVVQFWASSDFGITIFIGTLVMSIAVAIIAATQALTRQPDRTQVEALLQDGLSEAEVPKALELMLRSTLQQGETPPLAVFLPMLAFVILAALLAFFRPKNTLDLNAAGNRRLQRFQSWIRFWTLAAPSWIVLTVLALVFQEVLLSWLRLR